MFQARDRRGKRNFAVLKKDARRNFTLKRPWRFVWLVTAKFVVSRCAFCKLRGNFGFFCSVNHLNGPIRKHMFTCTSSKGHGFWFVIGGFRSVLLVSCFKVRCFVIVLFRAIIDELSLLRRLFWFFLFLSLARIKQPLPPCFVKKSIHHRDFLRYSWAVESVSRCIVICINPAFTKMIDGTENPKFEIRAARYNEFRC